MPPIHSNSCHSSRSSILAMLQNCQSTSNPGLVASFPLPLHYTYTKTPQTAPVTSMVQRKDILGFSHPLWIISIFSSSKDGQPVSIEHDHKHITICPRPWQSLGYLLEGVQEFAAQNVFELCELCRVSGDWVWNSSSVSHQGSVRPGGKVDTAFLKHRLL